MILSILKIIGILVLIILASIIFIGLMLLVVPVHYRFSGSKDEVLDGEFSVKWTPVLLKATAAYHNNKFEYKVKLFGGVVLTNTSAKLSWLGRKLFGFEQENHSKKDSPKDLSLDEQESEDRDKKTEKDTSIYQESVEKCAIQHDTLDTDREEKHKAFQEKWQDFLHTLKKINRKKEALLKIYHSERFYRVKHDLKEYMGRIFHILKPVRLEGNVQFGLENPANTGYVLGILAMIFSLYKDFLSIEPDFTRQIIRGYLKGYGKIRLISVVKLVIQVILNKNLIKVTKKVQTILEA